MQKFLCKIGLHKYIEREALVLEKTIFPIKLTCVTEICECGYRKVLETALPTILIDNSRYHIYQEE